jgi:hypothetical protein
MEPISMTENLKIGVSVQLPNPSWFVVQKNGPETNLRAACTRVTRGAHEHLRGEYKHIEVRAIAVDRPRAILVLSVGRAGQARPRSTRG